MLDWPSQIPDLNRNKNVWQNLKVIFRDALSTLTKLQVFHSKEWVINERQDTQNPKVTKLYFRLKMPPQNSFLDLILFYIKIKNRKYKYVSKICCLFE